MKASNLLASLAAMTMAVTPIAAQAGTRAGDAKVSLTVLSAQAPSGAFRQEAKKGPDTLLLLLLLLGAAGAAGLAAGGAGQDDSGPDTSRMTENDSSRGTGG